MLNRAFTMSRRPEAADTATSCWLSLGVAAPDCCMRRQTRSDPVNFGMFSGLRPEGARAAQEQAAPEQSPSGNRAATKRPLKTPCLLPVKSRRHVQQRPITSCAPLGCDLFPTALHNDVCRKLQLARVGYNCGRPCGERCLPQTRIYGTGHIRATPTSYTASRHAHVMP